MARKASCVLPVQEQAIHLIMHQGPLCSQCLAKYNVYLSSLNLASLRDLFATHTQEKGSDAYARQADFQIMSLSRRTANWAILLIQLGREIGI